MDNRPQNGNEGARRERMSGSRSLDEIGPDVTRQIEELRGQFDETLDRAAEYIRRRPAQSLLIAAGIGYLVGRIVRS